MLISAFFLFEFKGEPGIPGLKGLKVHISINYFLTFFICYFHFFIEGDSTNNTEVKYKLIIYRTFIIQ
jgi:hypothetical protein